jgi:hypothetical protein
MVKPPSAYRWEHEPEQERPLQPPTSKPLDGVGFQSRANTTQASASAAWKLKRDPASDRDRTLSALALTWIAGLPEALRPSHLNAQYPRITNRLAICWPDPDLAKLVLDDLIHDKRGGRKGFPEAVRAELIQLHRAVVARPLGQSGR